MGYWDPFQCLMGCTPVRGNNPRALESESSYVHCTGGKQGKTIIYHLHQCRPCAHTHEIFRAKVGKGSINIQRTGDSVI